MNIKYQCYLEKNVSLTVSSVILRNIPSWNSRKWALKVGLYIACPVLLESNSEVGEVVMVRCSISCVRNSLFKILVKRQTHSLELVPLEEDLVISLTYTYSYTVWVVSSIPRGTLCKMAWSDPGIPIHSFSALF